MADKPDLCPEKLEALFNKHDFNGDKTIEYKEIRPILKELGFTDDAIDDCDLDLVSILNPQDCHTTQAIDIMIFNKNFTPNTTIDNIPF